MTKVRVVLPITLEIIDLWKRLIGKNILNEYNYETLDSKRLRYNT